jgi:DNA mismatch repair protein MSH5
MVQLDEELGDLDAFIKDTESMIVSELEDDILDCETDLRATFGALADLDCILSFASCAADLGFVRPDVVDASEKTISITNGRHPLQELIIDTEFIPNDTHVDARCRINVITGPNFSGKSCYTRQVGVLVYMAHIGSFLPCDGAIISITDQILVRINTIETCAVPQSSFQLDLTQMGTILRRSTPYSLVLIDEFGKGKQYDHVRRERTLFHFETNFVCHCECVDRNKSIIWHRRSYSSTKEALNARVQGNLHDSLPRGFLAGFIAQ